MMTKSDFQAIADVLNDEIENMTPVKGDHVFHGGQAAMLSAVAHSMATMLGKQNPRFNREQFLAACGL